MKTIRRKKCSRCGYEGDEEAFFRGNKEVRRSGQVYLTTRAICIGCELSARNDPTPEARALRKARNSLAHHADKYEMPPKDFARRYGWDAERMAHDLTHALENTCVYCWEPYGAMAHGLDDITLDVIDPTKEPYYHTNVQWCCRTCNQEKSTLAPEIWARRLIEWRRWQEWHRSIEKAPLHGLPLFSPQPEFPYGR
jgi:hypothetical protein